MATPSLYQRHVTHLLGLTPELARQLVAQIQTALREASADIALAQDRNLLFGVSEAIQARRVPFEAALNTHIQAAIQAAIQLATPIENDPAQHGRQLDNMTPSEWTLVDEDQAEQEIDISRTVQLIDLSAEWELRELQALSAAMLGDQQMRPQVNPFRPATYAKGLSAAVRELGLTPGERHMLLRVGGRALADLLRQQYAQACERLRQDGVTPLAFKAVTTPRRPRASDLDVSQTGALQSLLERLPISVQLPQVHAAQSLTFQHLPDPAAMHATPQDRRLVTPSQVIALLNGLFDQMHADEDVQPAIKTMIGHLQPAVMRAARQDPEVLSSVQHPAWRLINQLASYASGYAETDSAALTNFVDFIEPHIRQLTPPPGPTIAQFQHALHNVQQFVERQSQATLETTPQAVAQLQAADQRLALRPILLQQVEQQLEGARVKPSIKDFLLSTWVDVMAHAMANNKDSKHDNEAQAMVATVDDLIQSLQRPTSLEERDALKQALPGLVDRLQRGMASIAWPKDKQDAILRELMGIHGHHLLAAPKASIRPAEPSAADLVQQMRAEMNASRADRQAAERPAQPVDTNVGILPTVPMAYGDERPDQPQGDTPAAWMQSLRKGMWCKLVMQGQWTTAHLLWVSDNRQFFVFTSDRARRMHSMTRGALERLRAEGLATNLEDRSLIQRAVDSMLQDLE